MADARYLHPDEARRICADCPVIDECLTYALDAEGDVGPSTVTEYGEG